jgi:tetratricopeptide (TPR) repeat protein
MQELQAFTEQAERLRRAGLDVVALSVDEQARNEAAGSTLLSPDLMRKQLGFPFRSGRATDELIARLRCLYEMPFATHVEMPVPTSFLIDGNRQLAVIYRGPVDVSQVLSDVQQLKLHDEAWTQHVLPMPGRWNDRMRGTDLLRIPREMVNREQLDDATEYVRAHAKALQINPEFPKLLIWLGDTWIARGRPELGLQQYDVALQVNPDHLIALNNVAWQLATHHNPQVRDAQRAVSLAERAARLTNANDSGVLDTLAASYAAAQRFDEAAQTARRAIQLVEESKTAKSGPAVSMRQRLSLYERQQPYRAPAPSTGPVSQ